LFDALPVLQAQEQSARLAEQPAEMLARRRPSAYRRSAKLFDVRVSSAKNTPSRWCPEFAEECAALKIVEKPRICAAATPLVEPATRNGEPCSSKSSRSAR
jgi:hypothetical protein